MPDCGFTSNPLGDDRPYPLCQKGCGGEHFEDQPCDEYEDAPQSARTPAGGPVAAEEPSAADSASCEACGGTGKLEPRPAIGDAEGYGRGCTTCGGSGKVTRHVLEAGEVVESSPPEDCPDCKEATDGE